MPIFRGSSRKVVYKGGPGSQGPTGATGATGDTGEAGGIGNIGNTGIGISFAESYLVGSVSDGITFTLTNGDKISVDGFRGSGTADVETLFFKFTNADQGASSGFVYKETVSTGDADPLAHIARFRTLEVRGNLISATGSNDPGITLTGIDPDGSVGLSGELLYLDAGNSAGRSTKNNTFIDNELLTITARRVEKIGEISTSDLARSNIMPVLSSIQEFTIGGFTGSNVYIRLGTGGQTSGTGPNIGNTSGFSRPYTRFGNDFSGSQEIDLGTGGSSQLIHKFEDMTAHTATGDDLVNAVGSCCFCSSPDIITGEYGTQCFDYTTKKYCDELLGDFSLNPCALRTEGPNCKETHPCCVNGNCVDTSENKCAEFGGIYFPNILNCEEFSRPEENGGRGLTCSNLCPTDNIGACCLNGVCYSFNRDQCDAIGGIFHPGQSCDPFDDNYYNCCLDLFPGACCKGVLCVGNLSPLQCANTGGFYQGAGTVCSGTTYDSERDESYGIVTLADGISQRLCCRDPEDVGNFSCQLAVNPCGQPIGSQVLSQDSEAVFIGYVGGPAENCTPLQCSGNVIPTLAENATNEVITYQPTVGTILEESACPCDHIHPVLYTLPGPFADLEINYVQGQLSELGFLASASDAPDNILIDPSDGSKFNEYADKIYGEGYTIHRRWALFVKKTDESANNVKWGIAHGIGTDLNEPVSLWGTCSLDGLLNTRLYDSSSIENNIWFSPDAFGIDLEAYDRWITEENNPWENLENPPNQNNIENFPEEFKNAYRDLWNQENVDSAMKLVSDANGDNPSNLDWYVPSLVELNHIYANQSEITSESSPEGWQDLSGMYWSSTSGSAGSHNYTEAADFGLGTNYNVNLWSDEIKYRAGSAFRAYTQDFSNGIVNSYNKFDANAKVRLVKRVPIYVVSKYCYTANSFPTIIDCNSCGPCPCGGEEIV